MEDKVWFPPEATQSMFDRVKHGQSTTGANDFTFFFHKREALTQIHTPSAVERVQKELLGWSLLREQSDLVQTDACWMEFIDSGNRGTVLFSPTNEEEPGGRPVTFQPLEDSKGPSIAAEKERQKQLPKNAKGWASLSAMNAEEWRIFRDKSTKLRKITEPSIDTMKGNFYFNDEMRKVCGRNQRSFWSWRNENTVGI